MRARRKITARAATRKFRTKTFRSNIAQAFEFCGEFQLKSLLCRPILPSKSTTLYGVLMEWKEDRWVYGFAGLLDALHTRPGLQTEIFLMRRFTKLKAIKMFPKGRKILPVKR